MKKLKLKWGSNEEKKGWKGLNNAAINSFNGNIINSFTREMFQNSNDARDKELPADPLTGKKPPLVISINYKTISQSQFPDYDGFRDIFNRIKSAKPNDKHEEFFKNAEKGLGNRLDIKLFIFEDFNTTGLSGDDNDDNSSFSGCVLSEGISINKAKTAGGSYGIGKNAIFGFSKLRTVFYSSYNTKNEYIFQGVAKLATYIGADNKKYSDRIFCGVGDDLISIRNIAELDREYQDVFKRETPGLSQYAVCPSSHHNWIDEFAKAILRNYWMLLDKGELIVYLKEEDVVAVKIENSNLEELFKKYFNPENYENEESIKPEGNPYEFYRCYKEGDCIKANINHIGETRFFFRELEHNRTNFVAYLRNDMVVYTQNVHGFGSINYCGVFICDDGEGNSILRDMEPPTHDTFSPERLDEKSTKYTSLDGRKVLKGIRDIIKESLQKISDKYKKPAEDIPWLDDLLSSILGERKNGSGQRKNLESDQESPERIGKKFIVKAEFPPIESNTYIYAKEGDSEISGSRERQVGKRKAKPQKSSQPGPKEGHLGSTNLKIESRVYKTNFNKSIEGVQVSMYKMFLTSVEHQRNCDLLLSQVGDNGNVMCCNIYEVLDEHQEQVGFIPVLNSKNETVAYKLKSLVIPNELSIYLTEPYKSCFKVEKV